MNQSMRITQARLRLLWDKAGFFGQIGMHLKHVEVTDPAEQHQIWRGNTPTLAVDGVHLFYSPEFIETQDDATLEVCLAHEYSHIAAAHHLRMLGRDPDISNEAADHAANLILQEAGFTIPDSWLCEKRFLHMSYEEVHRILEGEPRPPKPAKPHGLLLGFPGDGKNQPTKEEIVQALAENMEMVTMAAQSAAAAGNLPGSLRNFIKEQLKPAVSWQDVLRQFATRTRDRQQSWKRMNRGALSRGLLMPSNHSEQCQHLVLAMDSSGSTHRFQAQFVSEFNAILADVRPQKLTVIIADCQIQSVEEYTPDDYPVQIDMRGQGGTSFVPVFDYIKENLEEPTALLYLTDLEANAPDESPGYPVLWVATNKHYPHPWGERVDM